MEVTKVKGTSSIYGLAQVRLTKKSALIKMDKDSGGKEFEIDRENCPDGLEAGHWSVTINAAGDKLFAYKPILGTFKAKFLRFAAAKDSEPAPEWKESTYVDPATGKRKPGQPKQIFNAIILVEGQYEYLVQLPYRFDENDEGNTYIPYKKMGTWIQKLLDFLEMTGVKEKAIPYTENILPALQEMICDEDKEFTVAVKNGWIDAFSPPYIGAAKKAKAKAKKK